MINEIKNAVTKKISDEFKVNIYTEVIPQKVIPPCFFVEMFPAEFAVTDAIRQTVKLGVRVAYVSKTGSQNEFLDIIQRLNKLFLGVELTVKTDTVPPVTEHISYDKDMEIMIAEWNYICTEFK